MSTYDPNSPEWRATVTAVNGVEYRTPDPAELAKGTDLAEHVVSILEAWAPNHMTDTGRVESYDDWIERVDGNAYPDAPDGSPVSVLIDLGTSTDTGTAYHAVKRLAQALAKELR